MLIDDIDIASNKPVRKPNGRRVSAIPTDPGYRLYCELHGDGKKILVFLNGKATKGTETADEREGFVYGPIITAEGNLAFDPNLGVFLYETLYGDVRLEIKDA